MAEIKSVDFYGDAKRVFENLNDKKVKTIQEHDSELLDKVMQKWKTIIDEVIAEMKAEVNK